MWSNEILKLNPTAVNNAWFWCRRILRNRPKTTPAKIDLEKLPVKTYQSITKENPHRIKGAIGKSNEFLS